MQLRALQGRTVCILGFGREGQATLRALQRDVPDCEVTIADHSDSLQVPPGKHWLQQGTGWLQNLEKFDCIIKSPGIPPHREFDAVRGKITNATQLFLDTAAELGCTVIGVTGSKGKSTTASLIAHILQTAGRDTALGGNIGVPALDLLPHLTEESIAVLELSSYQLQELTTSPHIALLTSFFPEHLDYHGSLDLYREAKEHLTRFQSPDDVMFYPVDSLECHRIASLSPGKKIAFSAKECPVPMERTKLIGTHNQANMAGAAAVAHFLGIPATAIVEALESFHGLAHRLQSLGTKDGIEWVDDAISTTPESTIAAIEALGNRVETIILGGLDRGYDFQALAQRIAKSTIRNVILFPGSGPRIRLALEQAQAAVSYHEASTMEDAVHFARSHTKPGFLCLLSTASPSYGMFKNFEEKGEQFRAFIGL